MDIDPRLAKLSQFVRNVISDSGKPSVLAFYEAFAKDRNGNQAVGYTTFAGLVNSPTKFPQGRTFSRLAEMLSRGAGREISTGELLQICEFGEGGDTDIDTGPLLAEQLASRYGSLKFRDRRAIAPELLRIIADDNEFSELEGVDRVRWLIARELAKQGLGIDDFAKNFVGVKPVIIRELLAGKVPKMEEGDMVAIATRVCDENGEISPDSLSGPMLEVLRSLGSSLSSNYLPQSKPPQTSPSKSKARQKDK